MNIIAFLILYGFSREAVCGDGPCALRMTVLPSARDHIHGGGGGGGSGSGGIMYLLVFSPNLRIALGEEPVHMLFSVWWKTIYSERAVYYTNYHGSLRSSKMELGEDEACRSIRAREGAHQHRQHHHHHQHPACIWLIRCRGAFVLV